MGSEKNCKAIDFRKEEGIDQKDRTCTKDCRVASVAYGHCIVNVMVVRLLLLIKLRIERMA